MELALAFGRTLKELGRTMSSREFTMWVAYDRYRPFGNEMEDFRNAQVVQSLRGGKLIKYMPVVAALNNAESMRYDRPPSLTELKAKAKRMVRDVNTETSNGKQR